MLSCLKGGALSLAHIAGIATGDVDVRCLADAVFIETAVDGVTIYRQRSIGSFVLVAVRVVGLFIETGAAGGLLFTSVLTFDQDVTATATVVRVVNTGFDITIQTYHGVSSFLHISLGDEFHHTVLVWVKSHEIMRRNNGESLHRSYRKM